MRDVGPFNPDNPGSEGPRAAAAALAGAQGGVISHQQLGELGLTRGTIDHWLATKRLHPKHEGVYSVGHEVVAAKGHYMAAVLACGMKAVLSHRSAADWWGVLRTSRRKVDVTAPGRSRHNREGIQIHRVRKLDPRDVTEHEGIPITTLVRTYLDLAEVERPRRLEQALENAERMGIFDLTAIEEVLRRSRGRHGTKPLRAALVEAVYEPLTRSELELAFHKFCRERDIERPAGNTIVEGYEVDMAWMKHKVIAELDGWDTHKTRAAFERDRRRDADLQPEYRVIRITSRWLTREPDHLEQTLRRLGL
jgi:very-short-patch-repair endonuclease/predicted transcriptional regulator of viral defense system